MSIYPFAKKISVLVEGLEKELSKDNDKYFNNKEEIKLFLINELCPSILSLSEKMGTLVDEEINEDNGKPLPTMKKKGPPGPPPKSLITINQMRALYTALEVLWMWGMRNYLDQSTNIILPVDGIHPTSLIITRKSIMKIKEVVSGDVLLFSSYEVAMFVSCLTKACMPNTFLQMMGPRTLPRCLVTLLCLKYNPSSDSLSTTSANDNIDMLLHAAIPRAMILSEIRAALAGPEWLAKAAGEIMSNILQGPLGLAALFESFLGQTEDGEANTSLQQRVAQLVCSVPKDVSKQEYFMNMAAQIKELFVAAVQAQDPKVGRACLVVMHRMAALASSRSTSIAVKASGESCRESLQMLIKQVAEPLLKINDQNSNNQQTVDIVVSEEEAVEKCVMCLHAILYLSPPTSAIAKLLYDECGEAIVALAFFLYNKGAPSPSSLREPVIEMIVVLLRYLQDGDVAVEVFSNATKSRIPGHNGGRNNLRRHTFAYGGDGGIEIVNTSSNNIDNKGTPDGSLLLNLANLNKSKSKIINTSSIDDSSSSDAEDIQALLAMKLSQVRLGFGVDTDGKRDTDGDMGGKALVLLEDMGRIQALTSILTEICSRTSSSSKSTSTADSTASSNASLSVIETLASEIFIRELRKYWNTALSSNDDETTVFTSTPNTTAISEEERVRAGLMVVTMHEKVPLDLLLRQGTAILELIQLALDAEAAVILPTLPSLDVSKNNDEKAKVSPSGFTQILGRNSSEVDIDNDEDEDEGSMLGEVLPLLGAIVGLGADAQSRSAEEEAAIKACLPALHILARATSKPTLSQTAADVALMIITRAADLYQNQVKKEKDIDPGYEGKNKTAFEMVLHEAIPLLKDENAAMRGLGVRNLIVALREPKEALRDTDKHKAMEILLETLTDTDTFVYLNVVHALGRLLDVDRGVFYPRLLTMFTGKDNFLRSSSNNSSSANCDSDNSAKNNNKHSIFLRAKIAETLMCAVRRAGQAAPVYVPNTVAACLLVIRESHSYANDNNDTNDNMDRSHRNKDDKKQLLEKEVLILRISAVSLLAESVVMGGHSALRGNLVDAMDVGAGCLRQSHAEERRAGSFLLRHITAGLASKMLQVEKGKVSNQSDIARKMQKIYNYLKIATGDKDQVTSWHAQAGLGALDEFMRGQLFLKAGSNDESNKDTPLIRVLSSD